MRRLLANWSWNARIWAVTFVIAILAIDLYGRGLHRFYHLLGEPDIERPLVNLRLAVIYLYAALAAGLDLYQRHPVFNEAYRGWLKLSPWRPGRPLPNGSLAPCGWDLLIAAALVATQFVLYPTFAYNQAAVVGVFIVFFAARSFVLGRVYEKVEMPFHVLGTGAFLLALPLGVRWTVWFSAAVILVLQLVHAWWEPTVWRKFPWSACEPLDERRQARDRLKAVWPYNGLTFSDPPRSWSPLFRACVIALAMWGGFVAGYVGREFVWPPFVMMTAGLLLAGCVGRLAQNMTGLGLPFDRDPFRGDSLWARYLNGYRAWLSAAAVPLLFLSLGVQRRLPEAASVPLFVAAILIPLLFAGPDPYTWLLTAPGNLFSRKDPKLAEEL